MSDQKLVDLITSRLNEFLAREDVQKPVRLMRSLIPEGAELFLYGGAIRNMVIDIFFGAAPNTADLDFVIGNLNQSVKLENLFSAQKFCSIDLGGIRWYPENTEFSFDLCLLQDFLLIKKYRLEPNVASLLRSTDFTVNAIVYDIQRGILHQRRCICDIEKRLLDFNTLMIYDKLILIYRILIMSHKTNFILSENVFRFLKTAVDLDTIISLKTLLVSKLGKDTAREILKRHDRFSGYSDYGLYRKDVLASLNA